MQAKTALDREQAASTQDKDAKNDKSKQKLAPPVTTSTLGKPPQTKEESKVLEGMIQANGSQNFDFTLAKP